MDPYAFLSPAAVEQNGAYAPLLRTPMERRHEEAGARLEERDGWRVAIYDAAPGDPWIADVSHEGKLEIRAPEEQLDELAAHMRPGQAREHDGVWTLRITPTRALALCPFERVAALRERIGSVRVVDLTSGLAAVAIGGSRVRDLFRRSSALDVRPRVFPYGRCMAGSVMRCPAIVLNEDGNVFRILVGWELGEYLWDALEDAGETLALTPATAPAVAREAMAARP
jgi:heterotetrameric sarcosine oxidase gamma subunit